MNEIVKTTRDVQLKEFKKEIGESIKLFRDLDQRTGQEIEVMKKALKTIPSVLVDKLPISRKFAVSSLKKYDVIYLDRVGGVPHHAVVIKVNAEHAYVINVTSSKSYLTGKPIKKNRVFEGNYYVNEIKIIPINIASISYVFTLSDGRKEFQEHLDEVLKLYQKLL